MDLFRRLLGALHQTVDYIATFTTYLLGDAAHPGAEESGSTRETAPRRSHQDCDAETAWDISPGDDLKAFEGPPISETISPKQDIQEASGKDFSSAQATEAILGTSKSRDEGQEDDGQKLSEPPNFLADAPKSRSSTTSSIQQRDLEGPTVTGGPHQWEPEGWARMGAVQKGLLEETADTKASKPEKPLAGGQEHEEIERAGEAEGTWQKEQKETEGDEQEAPGEAETVGEEQSGSDEAERTGGFQKQGARMVEDLRSKPDGEFVGRANMEDNQKVELDIKVGDEEVQPAVPLNAENGGDQQRELGEAKTKSHPQWKPEEKGTFEAQKEDPQGPTEEEDGQRKGLGGFETVGPQLGELEGFVKNEGTEWKEQKENEGDCGEGFVEEGQRRDGTSWTGGFRPEMAKMVEDLRSEPEGQLAGDTNMEANQLKESSIDTGNQGVQPAMADSAETGGDQQGEPEGEAGARSHPQWETEERVILEVQEKNPEEITEKGGSQQRGLEEAEMEEHQQWELEGFVRNEETQQREQGENRGDEPEAIGGEESMMEEQRGEGTAWTGRSQEEVDRMAEGQWLEVERQLSGGVDAENYKLGEPDIETEDKRGQQSMLDGAESGGDQQGRPEPEAEGRSSLQWEPEEIVALEVQEEDPKEITEKGGCQQIGLEEAEMEAHQQWELEGFLRNEKTLRREKEEKEGDEQEATYGEQQSGDGTAWTGRSQQEVSKMADGQWLEAEWQLAGGSKAENYKLGEPDIETEDERGQQSMLDGAESRGGQQGGPEQETEGRSSLQWEPEEIVALEVQEEDPKEIIEKGDSHQRGLEEVEVEETQKRELEGFLRNEKTLWREKEEKEGDEQEATYGEQQSGDGTAWTGRSQQEVAKMADGQWLEAEWQLAGGSKAENNQQGEADMETGDEGAQQTILDGAESRGGQQGGQEGEAEARKNLQWEPEKTMTLEEHREEGNGQEQVLGRAGEREKHQHEKPEGLVRNEVENEEEEQEEQLGKPSLERDQQKDPEAFTGITVLEEVVAATMMEEPEVQGQEPRETEGAKRNLPHEPLRDVAPVDKCLLAGSGTFPDEVPSLDTSPQKERVLLRRKSSIRRAPSLKRPRPPTEIPPPQETCVEELSPTQPPSSGRPKLKHAGFGPMHPNMMAELQMRLRKPQ